MLLCGGWEVEKNEEAVSWKTPAPQALLKGAEPEASAASWAIRFAASLDGVITVLSGMSNVEQMKDNLSQMKDFKGLTAAQLSTIQKAQEALARIPLIPCTNCNYCAKVCPKNIGISASFNAMNLYTLYNNQASAKQQIMFNVTRAGKLPADQCVKCGKCEKVCEYDAITIENNLSYIDFNKCQMCTTCVDECPTGAIVKINFPITKEVEVEG